LESAQDTWLKALGELQTQVSRSNYNTWLRSTHGVSHEGSLLTVGTPSAFVAEWLTRRLCSLVKKTLTHVVGEETDVEFVVRDQARPQRRPQLASALADGGATVKSIPDTLNPRQTFDSFVVGGCNRLAFATALEVGENPANTFNPLYIYSDTGQGKTHLLHSIGNAARLGGRDVLYTTAERFTDEFVLAVKQKRVESFHSKFKTLAVLLFDDIQFLANKRQTQQCFYHIFDELHQAGCQVAITGDRHPREIQALNDKLRSRIESGMVAAIQPPDYEARLSFLESRASESDVVIPADSLRLLAEEVRGNMRQLEGAIVYLTAQARLTGGDICSQTVHTLLTGVNAKGDGKTIISAVSDAFDVSIEDLLGKKRDRKTALARHAAMYIMRARTNHSLAEIGRELGNRNHATILHGCNKFGLEMSSNPKIERAVARINAQLSREPDL
jgi:chromosomal replication initiator protein